MQQPDHLASVNNCPTNSHTMAQQSNNNFNNGSSASMQGLSANTNQLTLSNKSNFNKDASNGSSNSKLGRTPRPTLSGSGGGNNGGNGSSHVAAFSGRRNHRRGGGGGGGGGAKHRQEGGANESTANLRNYKNNFQPKQQPGNGTAQAAVAAADEFEAGSVFRAGSKKQSLNHLLNFQFEPRGQKQAHNQQGGNGRYNQRGKKKTQDLAPKPKYVKEQYLQANCQFAVRSGPDYSNHLNDPDLLVDWDLIEQVVLKTSAEVPSCPICLSPPVAAKITRCGHVYCWTCILHYLSLSDDESRKCPICFEDVCNKDLKSVISVPMKEIKIGDEFEMTLMRRERHSLFALPVDQYFAEVNGKHPNIGQHPNNFSQLVMADPQQVSKMILGREQVELLALLEELKNDPTVCYVEQALQMLAERDSSLSLHAINIDQVRPDIPEGANIEKAHQEDVVNQPPPPPAAEHPSSGDDETSFNMRARRESSSSEGSLEQGFHDEEEEETNVTAKDLDFSDNYERKLSESSSNSKADGGARSKVRAPKETFYFYQSSDGQPIFLHAMNVEMLIAEYGSFEACPLKIRGKILERDAASMTCELRNKLRYLAHIPVACAFEVVEIDLQVSKEVRAQFSGQLEARRARRNKRARDERRREKRIQVVENKIMGKYTGPKRNLHLESEVHFPEIGDGADGVDGATNEGPMTAPPPRSGGSSFAKMLLQSQARPTVNRSQQPRLLRSETFPAALVRPRQGSESEPEDYVPPPPSQSIGDALASALANASITEADAANSSKKKGKKVKGKKIDLFSGPARPRL